MVRGHSSRSGAGQLVFALGLMAVVAYRPGWIASAFLAYAEFWDKAISPLLVGLFLGG